MLKANYLFSLGREVSNNRSPNLETVLILGATAVIGFGYIVGLAGCNQARPVDKPQTTCISEPPYNIKQLKNAIGYRWKRLDKEEKQRFEKEWNSYDESNKEVFIKIYGCSEEAYEEAYKSSSKKERESFDNFDVSTVPKKYLIEYKKDCPWINLENPTLSDKAYIYYCEFMRGFAEIH